MINDQCYSIGFRAIRIICPTTLFELSCPHFTWRKRAPPFAKPWPHVYRYYIYIHLDVCVCDVHTHVSKHKSVRVCVHVYIYIHILFKLYQNPFHMVACQHFMGLILHKVALPPLILLISQTANQPANNQRHKHSICTPALTQTYARE